MLQVLSSLSDIGFVIPIAAFLACDETDGQFSVLQVYSSLSYIGFVLPMAMILVCVILRKLLHPKSAQNGVSSSSQQSTVQ